jgi:predicted MPP superfamily phosphohydrolase
MSITRRVFLRFTAGAATLATGLGKAIVGYAAGFEPNDLVLERKTVKLLKLPNAFDGFRIVLLTDLHLHPFTSANLIRRTVEISNSLKPDLVLLGGDYVCGFAEAALELGPILESLDAKHGPFAVLGNHDHFRGERIVLEGLRRASIPVLMNEGVELTIGDASVFLAGLDSVSAGKANREPRFPPGKMKPSPWHWFTNRIISIGCANWSRSICNCLAILTAARSVFLASARSFCRRGVGPT